MINLRHVLKSLSWRIFASIDTFFLVYLLTGSFNTGFSILSSDFIIKFLVYYMHEGFWFKFKIKNLNKRHFIKSFSWRILGSLITFSLSWIITGNPITGLKIGAFETITKILLYYFHEKIWQNLNFHK